MMNDQSGLDSLFKAYRDACPDREPSANFMPGIWHRIEARHNFWFVFQQLARPFMTASAALCLFLIVLNLVSSSQPAPATYADALANDHTAEKVYYTEAIRSAPSADEAPAAFRH